ncbi:isoamyl acetate-hydrolyzing esterase 1 homolog [Aquarana catesbeiana]|uniref:isoamyl acetate-hydrolyzing esterase 1 homolog n=1 Tax=Aquarana catesbeiana TaxID=8400 RepID=UPI003CCA6BFA
MTTQLSGEPLAACSSGRVCRQSEDYDPLSAVFGHHTRLILIAPPPIYEPSWEKQCFTKGYKLNRLNSIAEEYAKACVCVGQDCGTEVLDLWTLMQEGGQDYTVYLSDGLHLSDKGNEFLESKLWPILEQKLGALPFLLPYWMDVDNKNPEPSLFPNCTEKKEEKS